MKKHLKKILFICSFLLLTNLLLGGSVVKAFKITTPPEIDGKLDDICWKKATPITNFIIKNTKKIAKSQTISYLLYDKNNLYIGFKCLDSNIKNIKSEKRRHDGYIFHDDCVEVMLDPWQSKDEYFHFVINASGSIYDAYCSQGGFIQVPKWNGQWEAKTFIGKDYWSAEIRIPYYNLGLNQKVNSTWGINLLREKKHPFRENSSIAKDGAFNLAGKFGQIKNLNVDFNKYFYRQGTPKILTEIKNGKLNVLVNIPIENLTGKPQRVKLSLWLIAPNGTSSVKTDILTFNNDNKIKANIGPISLDVSGEYDCYITISDNRTKQIYSFSKSKMLIEYIPMSIKVLEPFYHDAIFDSQKLKDVAIQVNIHLPKKEMKGKNLTVKIISQKTHTVICKQTLAVQKISNKFIFHTNKLPYGQLQIIADIKDAKGKTIAQTKHIFKKLPYKKGEVWVGKDGNCYIDGKPFFFIGSWGHNEDTNKYYNAEWRNRTGKKRILMIPYWINYTKALKAKKLSNDLINYTIEIVKQYRDKPNFFAYHLADEPEGHGYSAKILEKLYKIIIKHDPYHPVILTHNSFSSFKHYFNAADINTSHTYPPIYKNKKINDLSKIGSYTDDCVKFNAGRRFVGTLLQSFNYGDYGSVDGRISNYQEFRTKLHLAIIFGAKGIIFFNRFYLHYPELYIGIPHLAQELDYLGKAIIAQKSKKIVQTNTASIKTLLKEVNGELYLFAVNDSLKPIEAKIKIADISKINSKINVVSENRSINIKANTFKDQFDAFETHIYTTSNKKTKLLSVKDIEAKIAKTNQNRKKQGNIAFQMFEGDGVKITASSNKGDWQRPDNGLWHLVDGVIDEMCRSDVVVWSDKTPNKYPDWVQIELPKKHHLNRMVIYTPQASLKDYQVQIYNAGNWKTIATVTANKSKIITHKFASIIADKIRLLITATNGPNSKISEIELY
jgi:hypothetical protein